MVNVPTLPFAKFPCHIAFPNGIEFAVFGAIQLEFELVGMLLVLSHFLKIGGVKLPPPLTLRFTYRSYQVGCQSQDRAYPIPIKLSHLLIRSTIAKASFVYSSGVVAIV